MDWLHRFYFIRPSLWIPLLISLVFFNGCSLIANTADCLFNPVSLEAFPPQNGPDPEADPASGNAEKSKNPFPPYAHDITAKALQLHNGLFVADLHADTLLWRENILRKHEYGHADIPRLIEGNVALQVFSVFTKIPLPYLRLFSSPWLSTFYSGYAPDVATLLAIAQLGENEKRGSLKERALFYAKKLRTAAKQSDRKLTLIESKDALKTYLADRTPGSKKTAGILSLEGAHALEGDPKNVDDVFKAGFRMMSLTHFFDNEFAGSSTGAEYVGLQSDGEKVIQKMGQLKMILDLSHASHQTIDDILKLYDEKPFPLPGLVVSHIGTEGTCRRGGRNLTDRHIERIVQHGGLIGIGLYSSAMCGESVENSIDALQRVISITNRVDRVALGSDFDGAVKAHFDARGMPLVTQALQLRGMAKKDIAAIMGENAKDFFMEHLPEKSENSQLK